MPKYHEGDDVYVGGVKLGTVTDTGTAIDAKVPPKPIPTGESLNAGKTVVTITFDEPIFYNSLVTATTKALFEVATDGTTFSALGASDTVAVTSNRVVTVTFNSALSTATNKIKMGAEAVMNNIGGLNDEYITEALDAS